MKLLVADFAVDIGDKAFNPLEVFDGYIYEGEKTDFFAHFTEAELAEEKTKMGIHYRPHAAANYCSFRRFAEQIPLQNAFVFHSATFDVDGVGVAFAAHSGTGKTTHMLLWKKLLGDRMTIVNGDKPIVRFFDVPEKQTEENENFVIPYAYGTPWNGKEHLGCNMRTPLRHICFIERAEQNSCEKMDRSEAIDRMMNQVYMPNNPAALYKTIQLIDRLISACTLWKIHCNMEPEAAKVSYQAIFENAGG